MASRVRSSRRFGVVTGRLLAIAGVIGGSTASLTAQQTGAIEGRVTDAGTGRPVPAAQVIVAGTTVGAATNESGHRA